MGRELGFFRASGDAAEAGRAGPSAAGSGTCGWGAVFTGLIAAGHDARRLGEYTERQLRLYFREAMRREDRQQARLLLAVNAGMAGGEYAEQELQRLTDV